MTNQSPTNEQIKTFWEWCGFRHPESDNSDFQHDFVSDPEVPGLLMHIKDMPIIDLNNLFRYAVPKLSITWIRFTSAGNCTLRLLNGKEFGNIIKSRIVPEMSLFWTIWKVIHDK